MYDTALLLQKPNLRIDEAAALLGVHHNTIRRWIDEGKLTGVRMADGHRRVATASILEFL
ncbi:putative Phage terminase, subunit Nu1 [Nitrospira defluvii]|jgi:excisionase family DNA binding protein|uniref:Putative Phage terminase, subunit Nu1 n=1 Tax=Nitrospira defluvii TaxID=330214 RepID=D8P824_9BACT|nr:putative Phage terminase, subunit Nu1 [Nitrospira defluvii]